MPIEAPCSRRALAVLALTLSGGGNLLVPAADTNVIVVPPQAVAFEPDSIPVNVGLGLTLLRHRPTKPPGDAQLAACVDLDSVLRILRDSGRVEVIYRAYRDVACQPAGRVQFRSLEARNAFLLGPTSLSPIPRSFGLDLQADLRLLPSGVPNTPPAVALAWNGSWTGSVQLFSRWEALAVRTFNVVKTIPGITYERVEEDEDGFVNTGGSTELGGLFRRKKKKDEPKSAPPPKTAKAVKADKSGKSATAKVSAEPAAPPEREPSYSDEQQPAQVILNGSWLGAAGHMILQRQALVGGPEAGDFYFIINPSVDE